MSGQIYGAEVGSGYEGHWVRFAEPLDSEAWRQLYLYPGFGSAWGLEWPASPGKDCSCKVLFLKKNKSRKAQLPLPQTPQTRPSSSGLPGWMLSNVLPLPGTKYSHYLELSNRL